MNNELEMNDEIQLNNEIDSEETVITEVKINTDKLLIGDTFEQYEDFEKVFFPLAKETI